LLRGDAKAAARAPVGEEDVGDDVGEGFSTAGKVLGIREKVTAVNVKRGGAPEMAPLYREARVWVLAASLVGRSEMTLPRIALGRWLMWSTPSPPPPPLALGCGSWRWDWFPSAPGGLGSGALAGSGDKMPTVQSG
jgi:hypothetical protein